MKILKINKIDNFGVFLNINILYGRNYSGKISFSKIFRSLETKKIPTKYENPDFEIALEDNNIITPSNLNSFTSLFTFTILILLEKILDLDHS